MATTSTSPPPYWKTIHTPLQAMLTTLVNRIDRDKRDELEARAVGLRMYLVGTVRVVRSTYEVIEQITIDRKRAAVPLECAVAVPPLARVILEAVFSTTYVLQDARDRLPRYWKAAWANTALRYERLAKDHGNDPEWQATLAGLARVRDEWRNDHAALGGPLTAAELANPAGVRFPLPSGMRKQCDPARRRAFGYLYDHFYGDLSGAAHLSGSGMVLQVGHVLHEPDRDTQRHYATRQFGIAATLLVCLISVYALDVIREGGFAKRVIDLWAIFIREDGPRDIYEHCYADQLVKFAQRA